MSRSFLAAAFAGVIILAGCSSEGSTPADGSPAESSPTSTASGDAPTAEQTAWVGNVCTAAADLETSIEGIGSAATAGGDDVRGALETQAETIKSSGQSLADTLAAPPAANAEDPDVKAVQSAADAVQTSIAALDTSVQAVAAADGAAATLTALAGVATAAATSSTALASTAAAIRTAAQDGRGTLGQAFAANTSCTNLQS